MSVNPELAKVEEARARHERIASIIAATIGTQYVDPEGALDAAHLILYTEHLKERDSSEYEVNEIYVDSLRVSYLALKDRLTSSRNDKLYLTLRAPKEKLLYFIGSISPERSTLNYNVLRWRRAEPLLKEPIAPEELQENQGSPP